MSRHTAVATLIVFCSCVWLSPAALAQTREETVRNDRKKVTAAGFWMYNDIPGAFERAKATGKPIVVVLRCLPCHECVKLDDELVDTDPVIRPLLEQFVCVRQVATNGLDLELFQFDTDQSFAVFFLNADGAIYGRFGTRSHRTDWLGDVSLNGLAKALRGALELHKNYDEVKHSLAAKKGKPLEFASPERYPSLKGKFTDALNYEGNVVKSCIHCHQIGDARREFYWKQKQPIPERVLFPYPHPKVVGLIMDPEEMATIKRVAPDSPAAAAGLKAGDVIKSFDGQPMLSLADIQWVLDNVSPQGERVPMTILRDGKAFTAALVLDNQWRRKGDILWRVSTWGLRRMATGGMVLMPLDSQERAEAGLSENEPALLVYRAGKYGPHATARRKGFREGDIITSFDGREFTSEQDLLAYVVTHRKHGDEVIVQVRRGRRDIRLTLPIQP